MAKHRHKRETPARRLPRASVIAGPLAVMATASAVGIGVLAQGGAPADMVAVDGAIAENVETATSFVPTDRSAGLSRSQSRSEAQQVETVDTTPRLTRVERVTRPRAVQRAIANADTKQWTTAELNLWTAPNQAAEQQGTVEAGEHLLVTGRSLWGRDEIVVDGAAFWVTEGYLQDEEPGPTLGGSCTNGTSVPAGVAANIKAIHQAVCANFPEISTYGTFRSDGEHSQGIAIDIMVSGDRGFEVAEFIRENYQALGVDYLIYAQRIWSVQRSGEGWRGMSDRGSTTANHYDHVHVTVY